MSSFSATIVPGSMVILRLVVRCKTGAALCDSRVALYHRTVRRVAQKSHEKMACWGAASLLNKVMMSPLSRQPPPPFFFLNVPKIDKNQQLSALRSRVQEMNEVVHHDL